MTHKWIVRPSLLACSLLLSTLQLIAIAADTTDPASGVPIPTELQVLAAGWEDNFLRIRTLQVDAQLHIEDDKFLTCRDLDNRSYRDQTAQVRVWKDGAKVRLDTVFDQTFDVRQSKVHYHLPYGEYVMRTSDWQQRREELYRQHGVFQTTTRFLQADGREYNYLVEGKDLSIDRPTQFFPGPLECEWLSKGSILHTETFPEFLASEAGRSTTQSLEVTDLGPGRYAVNEYWDGDRRDGTHFRGKTCLVIDATQGYTVQSFTKSAGDQPIREAQYQYTQAGNAWVLVSAESRRYDWMRGEKKPIRTVSLKIDVSSLKVNEPVDPNVFTVDALNIQKGSLVTDNIADKRYLYNDVPIHLKAALFEAQSYLDRSPLEAQTRMDGTPDGNSPASADGGNRTSFAEKERPAGNTLARSTPLGTAIPCVALAGGLLGLAAVILLVFLRKQGVGRTKV